MANTRELRPIDQIKFRDDLYPRRKHDPDLVQKYADNLDVLPPIRINQHSVIIDGYHRWLASQTQGVEEIPVVVIETRNDIELCRLAIRANSNHGLQLSEIDRKMTAIRLYASGTGLDKRHIAKDLLVSERTVRSYLAEIDKPLRRVFDLYLQCYTEKEIADRLEMSHQSVANIVGSFTSTSDFGGNVDFSRDPDFKPPVYDIWDFGELGNKVNHFGDFEQQIVDNSLHLYTEPYDIVVVPYAYDGSTADVCRYRLRRCCASDLKPRLAMEDLIRQPLPDLGDRWSEVSLTYVSPSCWQGSFPDMRRVRAYVAGLAAAINNIAQKQSKGVIAILTQPIWVDYVFNLLSDVGLDIKHRVSCPPASEEDTFSPGMAESIRAVIESKDLLNVNQELIVWQV